MAIFALYYYTDIIWHVYIKTGNNIYIYAPKNNGRFDLKEKRMILREEKARIINSNICIKT